MLEICSLNTWVPPSRKGILDVIRVFSICLSEVLAIIIEFLVDMHEATLRAVNYDVWLCFEMYQC